MFNNIKLISKKNQVEMALAGNRAVSIANRLKD
jgi:hypothetical protein